MSDTSYPVYEHYGTNAQRLAFTPSPPATGQPIYVWYETDTDFFYIFTTAWKGPFSSVSSAIVPEFCEGRLTTESGVPQSITDRTAQGTIYFTPSTHSGVATTSGKITLYNGSALVLLSFTELSLALTLTSGKNYDVFVDYNSGTPQLVLSAAWTNDTTRADALGVQNGIIVKSGTSAYRWVGTIRASGANVTADSGGGTTTQVGGQRFVWNAYNQLPRCLNVIDTTNTWAYTTDTIRQANGAAGNKVEYVSGAAGVLVQAEVVASVQLNGNTTTAAKAGIGLDSTTAFSGLVGEVGIFTAAITTGHVITGRYRGYPGLGYHYVAWCEKGANSTCNFVGDNGGDSSQSGLTAVILG